MSATCTEQIDVSKFDGCNYDFLCAKMKTMLLFFNLWNYIDDGFVEIEDTINLLEMLETIVSLGP